MVLIRFLLVLLLAASLAGSASAHKKHKEAAPVAAAAQPGEQRADEVVAHPMSPAVHEAVKEDVAKL